MASTKKLDFSALKGKGKELSKRDTNFILAGAAFLILIAAYMLGFQTLSENATAANTKLEERTAYLDELKGYYENLSFYRSETSAAQTQIAANLNRLPVGFENEDFLLSMMRADEVLGTNMASISFNGTEQVAEFATYVNGEYKNVQGYRASSTVTNTMTYEQFKNTLDYIYNPEYDYTYLDSVSVTYNAENMELSTVMNVAKYFIKYDGMAYEGEPGYEVTFGKDNPFSSK